MRKIYGYLITFWKEEVKLPYLLVIMGFLGLSIFAQYRYDVTSVMDPGRYTITFFFSNIIFYSIPVLFSLLAYIYFYKRTDLFKNLSFWITVLYIICAFSFRTYIFQQRNWVTTMNKGIYDVFLIRCAGQVIRALVIFLLVFVFWKFSGHSKTTPFYGFKLKGVSIKPYFILLLLMVPLIVIASTQADFLHKYPTFKAFVRGDNFSPLLAAKTGIYEFLYGFDYVAIELFFRGFVVYALARYMGKGAIITMACMYVFIHFGKPMGETISSFFGGMILGVIAYETNSIVGGIIVHCGIAYMMEIGGFLGNSL